MLLNRQTAVQFLVRAWEQVSLAVLARAWALYFESKDEDSPGEGED
jgi:hypothetical protein